MRKKEQSAGKKKKEKKEKTQTWWQGRHTCGFEKKGDPLMFATERGSLCTCENERGTVRGKGRRKKKKKTDVLLLGGRRVAEMADVVRPGPGSHE